MLAPVSQRPRPGSAMRLGGVVAFSAMLGACRGDDATGKAGDPIVEPSRGVVVAPDPPYAAPAPSGDVIGHVRIGDPFGLVAKVAAQLAPPGQGASLTIDALRNAARRGADGAIGKAIALHLDPERPAACALLDPGLHAIPIACVFGFQRGLGQLLEDLGPEGRRPTSAQGSARYEVDGLSVHLHALGPDVVVAFDDSAFAQSRDYLQSLSGRGAQWDVEVTVHARVAIDRLAGPIDAATDELMQRAHALAGDDVALGVVQAAAPLLAAIAPIAAADGEAVLAELRRVGAQVDTLQLGARLDDDGLSLALEASPTPGSTLATAIAEGDALPATLLEAVPRHTWLLWLQRIGERDVLPVTGAFVGRAVLALGGSALGLADGTLQELATRFDPGDADYGDARAVALFNGPGTWGGAVLLRSRSPHAAGREAWRELATTATPASLVGPEAAAELSKIVRWRFTPDAFSVEGTGVDRFAVEPEPSFEKKLAVTLRDDELAAQLVAWIAAKPALFAIDRFDVGDAAAFVLAPGGSEAYAGRVAATVSPEARASLSELDGVLGTDGRARFVLALSLADVAALLHEALPPDMLGSLPKESGHGLGDVALVGEAHGVGAWRLRLRIGQPVIDLVRRAYAPATPGT